MLHRSALVSGKFERPRWKVRGYYQKSSAKILATPMVGVNAPQYQPTTNGLKNGMSVTVRFDKLIGCQVITLVQICSLGNSDC